MKFEYSCAHADFRLQRHPEVPGKSEAILLQKMISLVKRKLDDEIDDLFRLPLAEFTGARNALAARLKKAGRSNDAERVKLLGKPSVSAWTVNQLYWNHREEFDELIATGKRFRPASRRAGKGADMRDSLDARRVALVQLSELATELLREAGHNPSQETIRRVITTLEALSAYALLSDGPTPGRLTNDVDPPGFESLASLISGGGSVVSSPIKSSSATAKKATVIADVRKLQQAKIAAAKASLQDAKRSLSDARARAQSLESAQKKANAEAKEAEKYRRDAEQRLEKVTVAAKDATRRAQSVAAETESAAQAFADAKRTFEEATKELESLLRS